MKRFILFLTIGIFLSQALALADGGKLLPFPPGTGITQGELDIALAAYATLEIFHPTQDSVFWLWSAQLSTQEELDSANARLARVRDSVQVLTDSLLALRTREAANVDTGNAVHYYGEDGYALKGTTFGIEKMTLVTNLSFFEAIQPFDSLFFATHALGVTRQWFTTGPMAFQLDTIKGLTTPITTDTLGFRIKWGASLVALADSVDIQIKPGNVFSVVVTTKLIPAGNVVWWEVMEKDGAIPCGILTAKGHWVLL